MPRSPRDESPGYHHVTTRGNNKREIFVEDRDREFFCLTVTRIARKYGWTVLAYCLMDNHYHLLLSVGDQGLSKGMQELNGGYATTFNANHGRINHLFGRRFWNRRIKTHASLLNTVRYIVRNPRAAGGSKKLEEYAWTSYASTLGLTFSPIPLARDELLAVFGSNPEHALDEFSSATPLASHGRSQAP
ncbi:MAG TPA: transposase [Gaiellaceae bacterium]|nr:transposase [Gaiellaceae bacterium]